MVASVMEGVWNGGAWAFSIACPNQQLLKLDTFLKG